MARCSKCNECISEWKTGKCQNCDYPLDKSQDFKATKTGRYGTRDGRNVLIYEIRGKNNPLCGRVFYEGHDYGECCWSTSGQLFGREELDENDLIIYYGTDLPDEYKDEYKDN